MVSTMEQNFSEVEQANTELKTEIENLQELEKTIEGSVSIKCKT